VFDWFLAKTEIPSAVSVCQFFRKMVAILPILRYMGELRCTQLHRSFWMKEGEYLAKFS